MIRNATAYQNAIHNRIRANASVTRRRKLDAAIANDSPDFKAWLFGYTPDSLVELSNASQSEYDRSDYNEERASAAQQTYQRAMAAWRKRVGNLPSFLRDSLNQWGGLTDGQLTFARKCFAENVAKASARDEQDAARRANAPAWVAGRQTVTATLQMSRENVTTINRHTIFTTKGLWLLADGRKLWSTVAAGISAERGTVATFKVTIKLSDDDATMAFGSRPSMVSA